MRANHSIIFLLCQFYNFACGQYLKTTDISDDKTVVDTFSIVRDTLSDQLKTIITVITIFKNWLLNSCSFLNSSLRNRLTTANQSHLKWLKTYTKPAWTKVCGNVVTVLKTKKSFAELIESRGLKPINNILDGIGGWPAVKGDSWDEKSWTWQAAAVYCRKTGYSTDYVVDFSVSTDLKNSSTKIIDVSFFKCFSAVDRQ